MLAGAAPPLALTFGAFFRSAAPPTVTPLNLAVAPLGGAAHGVVGAGGVAAAGGVVDAVEELPAGEPVGPAALSFFLLPSSFPFVATMTTTTTAAMTTSVVTI